MTKIFNSNKQDVKLISDYITLVDKQKSDKITQDALKIVEDVRIRKDEALVEYSNKFDNLNIQSANQLEFSSDDIKLAYKKCSDELIESLHFVAKRIEDYHKKQLPSDFSYTDELGVGLGNIWRAIGDVGIYVPGGLASYPSSVLMNAIPAKVAGVKSITMVVPTPNGKLKDSVLAAAHIAGVDKIYKVGGSQAIAALAYGTETIKNVDIIVGPGNAYVASAKREVFGTTAIDMIAGPSEILVVADSNTDPKWIAADLLSQAEHDKLATSILITDSKKYAQQVIDEVENYLKSLSRADIASESWKNNGVIIVDENFSNVVELIDAIAPEHLELVVDNHQEILDKISNAGAVFLGKYTPEAIGDYSAGPSHVLPTSGTARFSSGLSVYNFLKRVSVINCNKQSFNELANATEMLAYEEGLTAHALSVALRKDNILKTSA